MSTVTTLCPACGDTLRADYLGSLCRSCYEESIRCYHCKEEFDGDVDNPEFTVEVYPDVYERVCRRCFDGEICEDCDFELAGALIWGLGEENTLLCESCWDARIGRCGRCGVDVTRPHLCETGSGPWWD